MEVMEAIGTVPRDARDRPVKPVVLQEVLIGRGAPAR